MNLSITEPCVLHFEGPTYQGPLLLGLSQVCVLFAEDIPFTLTRPGGEVIAAYNGIDLQCPDAPLGDLIDESVYSFQQAASR